MRSESGGAEQQAIQAAWKEVGIRVGVPALAGVRRVASVKEADGQAALMAKLNELATQVKELSGEVAELRATSVIGRAQQLHE